jgi:hypothetical protein
MSLRRLYNTTTGSLNPSYLTNLQPGGAGSITAGSSTNPGISAPRLEEIAIEVLDCTAPTLLGVTAQAGTPAAVGKLLVLDPTTSIGGANWVLGTVKNQPIPRGQFGIVISAGLASEAPSTFATVGGNRSTGTKAEVIAEGPIQAYVETTVGGVAISAGMALASDGAGNLTYAGASPAVGTVLARALGPVASSVSIPVLTNVYIGGY